MDNNSMMKVLVLPINVASISSITVESLNNFGDVKAKGFFSNRHIYHYPSHNSYYFEGVSSKKKPFKWFVQKIKRYFIFRKLCKWADIIHWVYDDISLYGQEKSILKKSNKPSVIEWVGSDIRNPEILFTINPYYKNAFQNGYEYAFYESKKQSLINQKKFNGYGALPLVNPEMDLYLNKELFPEKYYISHKLFLNEFISSFPAINKMKPLIVHSPTAKIAKGTNFILPVIEELKKNYDFDFRLLHDLPRYEVLALMKECDIFIDQLIIGMHGLASSEAMAFGKPVVCYLMPAIFENGFSKECPIVNTTIETLKETLVRLITNSELRYNIGKASREYAEENFDANSNAKKLVKIYSDVIRKHKLNKKKN